jgi:hypothetical protein
MIIGRGCNRLPHFNINASIAEAGFDVDQFHPDGWRRFS